MSKGKWKNPVDTPEFLEALKEICLYATGWMEIVSFMRKAGFNERKDTLVYFARKHKIPTPNMEHGGARVSDVRAYELKMLGRGGLNEQIG